MTMDDDNASYGSSSSSDSDSQEGKSNNNNNNNSNVKGEEQLGTRLRLRLMASHLPKVGGKYGLKVLTRTSPDTFASVTSIVRKEGNGFFHSQSSSLPGCAQTQRKRKEEEFMVEWGSTEIIPNTRSPQWVETIPLKYEYGSELFFYVRILQAAGSSASSVSPKKNQHRKSSSHHDESTTAFWEGNNHTMDGSAASRTTSLLSSPTTTNTNEALSPMEKNRKGRCFGTALFEVGDLLASRNYTKVKRLKSGGCIYARLEPEHEKDDQRVRLRFQLQGLNLTVSKRRKRMSPRLSIAAASSGGPDTLLEIARPHFSPSNHSWVTIFRSRPVIGSLSPCWDLAEIDMESCCPDNDLSQTIRLSVFRLKKQKQKMIGMCETTIQNILSNIHSNSKGPSDDTTSCEKDFLLQRNIHKLQQVGQLRVKVACLITLSGRELAGMPVAPLSPTSSSGIDTATSLAGSPISPMRLDRTEPSDTTTTATRDDPFNVDLRQMSLRLSSKISPTANPAATLNDFFDCGGQLDFCVAIDFTSSNGSPLQEGTLHFQSDEVLNDYEEVITAIGNAVDKYNTTSDYPVWGFGAKFGDGIVRHLFQCGQTQTVKGVEGILSAYRSVFRSGGIIMSGPTVFVKAIQAAAVRARNYTMAGASDTPKYCVLLIVTDGIMDNFEETREKLSVYSEVPLSIVIVGVGRTDFRSMYALCEPPGTTYTRKNTNFVEFREHQHDPRSLAQSALSELPKQISGYLGQNGIVLPRGVR